MRKITVVGLGPGAAGYLTCETMELLKSGIPVILRTAVHPTVAELKRQGINYSSCDDLYESAASFEEVYAAIVARLLEAAEKEDVLYAVPGSPLVAEATVKLLKAEADENAGLKLDIRPAMSFLDLVYAKAGLDPVDSLMVADAADESALLAAAGRYPLVITQVYSKMLAGDVKLLLMETLEDDAPVYFLRNLGLADEQCLKIKLYELDQQQVIDHLTSVYVPVGHLVEGAYVDSKEESEEAQGEENYETSVDIDKLVDIINILKAPDGCPWDRVQTHESIRQNLIEEVYEYLEAVDEEDLEGMQEELGDILMQVVFHAAIAEGSGKFNLQEVIDKVTDKLIRRHPHVFGDVVASNSEEALTSWEAVKKTEKKERKHVLDGIYHGLPTLLRANKLQSRAAKVGFDWQKPEQVWDKVEEELKEFKAALKAGDAKEAEKEFGDVLFALVNYARHNNIQPEAALNGTNNRFVKRFGHVEKEVVQRGGKWDSFTLEELDAFWTDAKKQEQ